MWRYILAISAEICSANWHFHTVRGVKETTTEVRLPFIHDARVRLRSILHQITRFDRRIKAELFCDVVSVFQIWNSLPLKVGESRDNLVIVKKKLKTHLS